MVKFLFLEWNELYADVIKLGISIIKSGFKPDLIVAIARGGWVIGRLLSDVLDIDNVASIRIRFYKEISETLKEPILEQPIGVNVENKKVLIVDDVVDTGKTIEFAKRYINTLSPSEVKCATLYKKPWAKITPDYYVREVDKWIVFPYEKCEFMRVVINQNLMSLKNAIEKLNLNEEMFSLIEKVINLNRK